MHALPLALLGLLLTAGPALASRPHDRSPAAPSAKAATTAAAPMSAAGRLRVSRPTAAHPMAAEGSRASGHDRREATAISLPGGTAGCHRPRRTAAARCRPAGAALGWMHGLSPALGEQAAECPAGTMATLATGHEDVVRCMPI
jgi:hypothetical protein